MASITKEYIERKTFFSIKLRFSSQRKSKYLTFKDIKIPILGFDKKKKVLKRNCTNYFELNSKINELDSLINNVLSYSQFNKEITCDSLMKLFIDEVEKKTIGNNQDQQLESKSFFQISQDLQEDLKSIGKIGNAIAYYYATKKLKKFYIYDLTLPEIKYSLLIDFKNHHLAQGEKLNSVCTYLSKLKAIYNEACKRYEFTPPVYPFKKGLITYQKTRKKNLAPEILFKLKKIELKGSQDNVRDLLLLSFYLRGLDIIDILTVKLSDISKGYIITKRKKLGDKDSGHLKIKIVPEALEIIEKYKKPNTLYLLPFFDQDLQTEEGWYNYKKVVSRLKNSCAYFLKKNELEIDLTFKSIRHSWATIARRCNLPYDVIQACLGHTNSDVTDVYIEYDQSQLDKANRVVIDAVFNKES